MPLADEKHLRNWAAYVIGHHPYVLRRKQQDLWDVLLLAGPLSADAFQPSLTEEIEDLRQPPNEPEEMDRACRILVLSDDINAGALVEFHRINDQMEHVSADLRDPIRALELMQFRFPFPPKSELLFDLELLSEHLLAASPLRHWYEVGKLIGHAKYRLGYLHDYHAPSYPREHITEIMACIEDLNGLRRYPFLREISKSVNSICEPIPEVTAREQQEVALQKQWETLLERKQSLERLDSEIADRLRQESAPGLVLVLSKESIEFFGQSIDIAACSQDQVACLWLLAETPRQVVTLERLNKDAKLGDIKMKSLNAIISRLRTSILRPMLKRYRRDNPASPLPGEKHAFVIGRNKRKVGSYQWGGYYLDLDPAQVRIKGPRPAWLQG